MNTPHKENKNAEKLASFTAYCQAHPEERFWQALRNWSEYNFIFGSNLTLAQLVGDSPKNNSTFHDTFYDE